MVPSYAAAATTTACRNIRSMVCTRPSNESEFVPGIVIREVLAQIAFGTRNRDSLNDFRTLGVDELTHFEDQGGPSFRGEQDWFTD